MHQPEQTVPGDALHPQEANSNANENAAVQPLAVSEQLVVDTDGGHHVDAGQRLGPQTIGGVDARLAGRLHQPADAAPRLPRAHHPHSDALQRRSGRNGEEGRSHQLHRTPISNYSTLSFNALQFM